MGRSARGVKGIELEEGDTVVAALAPRRDAELVAGTARGYGKRIPITEFRLQGRAGKGTNMLPERGTTGPLVGLVEVQPGDRVAWELSDGEVVTTEASTVLARARREASRPVVEPAGGAAVEAVHPVRAAPEAPADEQAPEREAGRQGRTAEGSTEAGTTGGHEQLDLIGD